MATTRARYLADALADEVTRVLYIATRRSRSAPLDELFKSMREDMASAAAVELLVDRRVSARRARLGNVALERRQAERRQYHELNSLARNGWARIVVGFDRLEADRSDPLPAGLDPHRVTLHALDHLRYWSDRLGCRPDRLKAAVRVAGSLAVDVEQYLRRGR